MMKFISRRLGRGWRGPVRGLVILLALAWSVGPLLFLAITSLRPAHDFLDIPPRLIPQSMTLDNFRVAIGDFDAFSAALNSLEVAGSVTVLSVVIGVLAGFGLSHLRIRPRVVATVIGLLLLIRFYPRVATLIPWFLSVRLFDKLDTTLAIILGHIGITVPFATWLLYTVFRQLPPEFDEAAVVDGASLWQRLTRVHMPLAAPGIASVAILTAILSWNEFLVATSTTRSDAKVLSITVASFITDKGVLWGPMAAMALMIMIPAAVFALFAQRRLVAGLSVGGVKG